MEEKRLINIFKNYKKAFLYAGLLSMFINILMLLPSFYMLLVYDKVMVSRSIDTLIILTVIIIALYGVLALFQVIRTKLLIRISNKIDSDLNSVIFDTIFDQARLRPGKISALPMQDLIKLRQFIGGQGVFALFDAPWFPIYLFVLYMFSPFLALFAVFAVLVLIALSVINEKTTKKSLIEANKYSNASISFINKNIQNSDIIHALGMEENIKKRWMLRHLKFTNLQTEASEQGGKLINFSKTLRQLFQSSAYGIGAYLAINGDISSGMIIAGAILLGRALYPIDLLINSWKHFTDAKIAYQRIDELLKYTQSENKNMELPNPEGNIKIENIVVVPPGAKQAAIKSLSMNVPKGEIVGVLGPSGSGKSTLAKAILGVWPLYSGKVRLDGADIHLWDHKKLGKFLGYLPQDIELFEGTIAENIARLDEVDSQKVIRASKIAGVHEMILNFPKGYDTKIGPGGIGLSGGQRQRIGLARAIYGEPKVIVLDEPNASLDTEGEIALNNTILTLKQMGVTVFIISHKMSILNHTTKIAYINKGKLEIFGNTKDVLSKLMTKSGQTKVINKNIKISLDKNKDK